MKVRATQDGLYGGYYRKGPIGIGTDDYKAGEVFEIDDKPFVVKDSMTGEPMIEKDDEGKTVYETVNGKKIPKIRMGQNFSSKWMERVNDDATPTYDYPPFELPKQMKAPKAPKDIIEAVPVNQVHGSPKGSAALENVI